MIYTPRVCKAMKLAFYAHAGQTEYGIHRSTIAKFTGKENQNPRFAT